MARKNEATPFVIDGEEFVMDENVHNADDLDNEYVPGGERSQRTDRDKNPFYKGLLATLEDGGSRGFMCSVEKYERAHNLYDQARKWVNAEIKDETRGAERFRAKVRYREGGKNGKAIPGNYEHREYNKKDGSGTTKKKVRIPPPAPVYFEFWGWTEMVKPSEVEEVDPQDLQDQIDRESGQNLDAELANT